MPTAHSEHLVRKEVKEFKVESKQLEQHVKRWEEEFRLKELNVQSEKCYKTFSELQMNIAALDSEARIDKHQHECFKIVADLISYFDCHVRPEDLDYIYHHELTQGFTHLWDYLHAYCNNMVAQYEWAQNS